MRDPRYRPDIDGLRGLAVLAVILFHAGTPGWAGGFAGVDVFFAISGYLITQQILTERAAGRFTLRGFYERRIRRLVPACTVVSLVTVALAWMRLPPSDLREVGRVVAATPFAGANLVLWRASGYFEAPITVRPLLHYWSLAVEEQFYLLYPAALLWLVARPRRTLPLALAAGIVGSLVLGEWGTRHAASAAFYLLPTRAWELLAGALVFAHESDVVSAPAPLHVRDRVNEGVAMLGLALIGGSLALLDSGRGVPGAVTLAPVVGTMLLVRRGSAQTRTARLLSHRGLVAIGLVSYSAYLWHQPLLAMLHATTVEDPSLWSRLGCAAGALALAVPTWAWIERPARDRRHGSPARVFVGAAAAAVVLLSVGLTIDAGAGFPGRLALPPALVASMSRDYRRADCYETTGARFPSGRCAIGDTTQPTSFAVIGDSHAFSLLPAFDDAARAIGRAGVLDVGSGCLPLTDLYVLWRDERTQRCHDATERALAEVERRRIPLVFLVAKWATYTEGGTDASEFAYSARTPDAAPDREQSRGAVARSIELTAERLARAGSRVVILEQVPWQRVDPMRVAYRIWRSPPRDFDASARRLSVSLAEHAALRDRVRGWFAGDVARGRVQLLSLDAVFCDRDRCPFTSSGRLLYMDEDHLTTVGARLADATIQRALAANPP